MAISLGPARSRGAAGYLIECVREARQRFVYCAAPPGVYGGLLVGLDGLVVLLCLLEVACDHPPVRLDAVAASTSAWAARACRSRRRDGGASSAATSQSSS